MNMSGEELKKCIGNTFKARQNGEIEPKQHTHTDRISGIQDKINALEERREIEANTRDGYDLH